MGEFHRVFTVKMKEDLSNVMLLMFKVQDFSISKGRFSSDWPFSSFSPFRLFQFPNAFPVLPFLLFRLLAPFIKRGHNEHYPLAPLSESETLSPRHPESIPDRSGYPDIIRVRLSTWATP